MKMKQCNLAKFLPTKVYWKIVITFWTLVRPHNKTETKNKRSLECFLWLLKQLLYGSFKDKLPSGRCIHSLQMWKFVARLEAKHSIFGHQLIDQCGCRSDQWLFNDTNMKGNSISCFDLLWGEWVPPISYLVFQIKSNLSSFDALLVCASAAATGRSVSITFGPARTLTV